MSNMNLNSQDGDDVADVPLTPAASRDTAKDAVPTETKKQTGGEEDVDALLQELDSRNSTEPENATSAAMSKLRQSTTSLTSTFASLTSTIDTKFEVSRQTSDLDSKLGISRTSSRLSSWWGGVQEMDTTKNMKEGLKNAVGKSTRVLSETVDKSGLGDVIVREKERLEKIDSEIGIRKNTIEILATGVDFADQGLKQAMSAGGLDATNNDRDVDEMLMTGDVDADADNEEDFDVLLTASHDGLDGKLNVPLEDDQVGGDKDLKELSV